MKSAILVGAAVLALTTGSAMADEYYVVSNPTTHHCTITTTKPAGQEVVTQIGPIAFKSRSEAETRMKTVKTCESDGMTGSSTTTIKEK